MVDRLTDFRASIARFLLWVVIVNAAIIVVLASIENRPVLLIGTVAAALALSALMSSRSLRSAQELDRFGFVIGPTLVAQTAICVGIFAGNRFQIEMHFYFFAQLAMIACLCDWRLLVLCAGLVVGQHIVFNAMMPALLYPGGSDVFRVLIHSLFVFLETVMLATVSHKVRLAFIALSEESEAQMRTAHDLDGTRTALQSELDRSATRVSTLDEALHRLKQHPRRKAPDAV